MSKNSNNQTKTNSIMITQEDINDYLKKKKAENLSDVTITTYTESIRKFFKFNMDNPVNNKTILDYSLYLTSSNLSASSINHYLRTLRLFLNYLDLKYATNLHADISFVKEKRKVVKIYEDNELVLMLDKLKNRRDYLMFLLMVDGGLRRGEVQSLNYENIDWASSLMLIIGKGGHERYVPMSKTLKNALIDYLAEKRISSGALFRVRNGERISAAAIKTIFTRLSRSADIAVSPHKLRHNFATNYLLNQIKNNQHADLIQLQLLLGHVDASTTKRYLHISQSVLARNNFYSHMDNIFDKK